MQNTASPLEQKFMRALETKDSKLFESLLNENPSFAKKVPVEWRISRSASTLLHHAIFCRFSDAVEMLLKKGANINERVDRRTALHNAVEEGNLEIVEILLSNGADVNDEIGKKLGDNIDTPLTIAARKGNVHLVKILIDKGADVNEVRGGSGPLHLAVRNRRIEVVRILLENSNLNVNGKSKRGDTALHVAIPLAQGMDEIITLLANHKDIDFEARDSQGRTAVKLATHWNRDNAKKIIEEAIEARNSAKQAGHENINLGARKAQERTEKSSGTFHGTPEGHIDSAKQTESPSNALGNKKERSHSTSEERRDTQEKHESERTLCQKIIAEIRELLLKILDLLSSIVERLKPKEKLHEVSVEKRRSPERSM